MTPATATKAPGRPPKDRLLALAELRSRIPLSKSKLYDEISHGRFPAPVKVGRSALWRLSEVEGWMASLNPTEFPAARSPAGSAPAHNREQNPRS